MSDQDLVVNRWRRYGKDRLYVETPDGTKVGLWDLIADSGKAESPEQEAALLAAVADWKSSSRLAKAATATTPVVATDGTTEAPSRAAAAPRAPEAPSPHAVDCHDAVSAALASPSSPNPTPATRSTPLARRWSSMTLFKVP